jgi:hypothetical protein
METLAPSDTVASRIGTLIFAHVHIFKGEIFELGLGLGFFYLKFATFIWASLKY